MPASVDLRHVSLDAILSDVTLEIVVGSYEFVENVSAG